MSNWSVGVRSMLSGMKHGRFESLKEIDDEIISLEQELVEARKYMRDLFLKRAACLHTSFKNPTFSIQRRLTGFVRVNERVCKNCGHLEIVTEKDDKSNKPEWAKDAKETYYNNNI